MSSLIPAAYGGFSSELNAALDQRSVRLSYQVLSSAGTQSVLIPAMAGATPRQFMMVGNGTADMSLANAQSICLGPVNGPITSAYQTQRANLATGMVTYFTNIPAAADSAYVFAFAIGGLNCSDVFEAVLRVYGQSDTVGVNYANIHKNYAAATVIGGPAVSQPFGEPVINLNGSNQILLQDGTTALTYGTHTMVICPAYGVIFGAIRITDVLDTANAGDLLELEVYFK